MCQWVQVVVFGKAVERAAELKKIDRCYIEGSIKLDSWRGNDGVERHGLSAAGFRCEPTHRIGRNRKKMGTLQNPLAQRQRPLTILSTTRFRFERRVRGRFAGTASRDRR
jgi:single-stranded DNA-binding protein